MEDSVGSGALVEGIGDEVLITLVLGGVSCILALAWYSTHLTSSQARLTAPTIHRSGVRLNRLQGSSTAEARANNQSSPAEPTPNTAAAEEESTEREEATTPTSPSSQEESQHGSQSTSETEECGAQEQEGDAGDGGDVQPSADTLSNGDTTVDNSKTEPQGESFAVRIKTLSGAERTVKACGSDTIIKFKQTHFADDISNSKLVRLIFDGQQLMDIRTLSSYKIRENCAITALITDKIPEASASTSTASEEPRADSFSVRLKFLTDSERTVRACTSDTVSAFKQAQFASELSENKLVRLIYNGQQLADSRTLGSYNIGENTTIHALITDNAIPAGQTSNQPDVVVFNAGVFMLPLFSTILAVIWYLRFEYGQFFNFTSTASLFCITAVFIFCVFAQHRTQEPLNRERHYGVNVGPTAS